MKTNPSKTETQPSADLVSQYRPLGLKAVLAAALQHKAKPNVKASLLTKHSA